MQNLKTHENASSGEFNALMEVVRLIVPPAVNQPELWEDGFRYAATKSEVLSVILERMNTLLKTKSSLTPHLKNLTSIEQLERYFDNPVVDFMISFDGKCYETLSPDVIIQEVADEKYGQWIRTTEMEHFIKEVRKTHLLKPCSELIIAPYGENHGGDDEHAVVSENFLNLYEAFRGSSKDCVGVVLLYLSKSSFEKRSSGLFSWIGSWFSGGRKSSFSQDAENLQGSQNNSHWITVVAAKIKGKVHYYVLDSLTGSNRLEDSRVKEVIEILDGQKELPGYRWTKSQLKGQKPEIINATTSWPKYIAWTALLGGLGYFAYQHWNKEQPAPQNP